MNVKEYVLVPSNIYERLVICKNTGVDTTSHDTNAVKTLQNSEIVSDTDMDSENVKDKDRLSEINDKQLNNLDHTYSLKGVHENADNQTEKATEHGNDDSLTKSYVPEPSFTQQGRDGEVLAKNRKNKKSVKQVKVKKLKTDQTQFRWVSYM